MHPTFTLLIQIIMLAIMLIGLFGLVVPVFPGITVIWVVALLHGLIFSFAPPGAWYFVGITLLTIVGLTVDNILITTMAREGGAHWRSIAAAIAAGFIGSLFLTPIGGIAAALGGLYLSEYALRRNKAEAWRATKGMALGWGWSFVARFGIGLVIIGLWALWAWA